MVNSNKIMEKIKQFSLLLEKQITFSLPRMKFPAEEVNKSKGSCVKNIHS